MPTVWQETSWLPSCGGDSPFPQDTNFERSEVKLYKFNTGFQIVKYKANNQCASIRLLTADLFLHPSSAYIQVLYYEFQVFDSNPLKSSW